MNVSRSHDGLFVFYRSEKFVFNKKLEGFGHISNGMVWVLVFPNGNTTANATPDCSSIEFPIQNRYDFH